MSRAPLLLAACLTLSCRGTPAQDSLFHVIPENALAAVVVRANALTLVRKELDQSTDMQRELSDYLVHRLNLDPSKLTAFAAFTLAPDAREVAAYLAMPVKGEPSWPKEPQPDGTVLYHPEPMFPVYAAVAPGGIILGTKAAALAALAVVQGKAPSLKQGSPLESLLQVDPASTFALAVSAKATEMPMVQPLVALYGVSSVVAGYSTGRVFAWASGDPALLKGARDALVGLIKLGLDGAKEGKDKAMAGDSTIEGASAIVTYHQFASMAPKLTPRLEGNRLLVDVAVPENNDGTLMMGVAMAGMMAAIAIPAFTKYMQRSKTVEATMNLRKLYDGEISYYEAEHADDKGNILPRAFPGSADWTPSTPCSQEAGGKCQPNPATFAGSPWKELNFDIDDPYYYQYRVTTTKTGFVLEARGDLDGDGKFSLFRREGKVGADGNVELAGVTSNDETE